MDSSLQDGQPNNSHASLAENVPQTCQLCHEIIVGIMVCCNICQKPHHDACAKDYKPHEAWTCLSCKHGSSHSIRSESSSQSTVASKEYFSSQQALELKRLEEERQLSMRRDEIYLQKKYQILQKIHEETHAYSPTSAPCAEIDLTNATDTTCIRNTDSCTLVNASPNLTLLNTQCTSHMPVAAHNIPLMSTAVFDRPYNHPINNKNNSQSHQFVNQNIPFHSTYKQNYCPPHANTHNSHFTQPPPLLANAEQSGIFSPSTNSQNMSRPLLTAEQLHARQTVPKDLPLFSGCPEEYPLFSSTYDWSTTVCGLTDAENLVRLQRSLRGEALEAVKGVLIHPSCVPHAISTLKVLYGQPEKILISLKNKIKQLPQVNVKRMDTITNFAVQVKGLLSTIEACGLVDELNNSSLLQELISKLPPHYQLNWGTQKLYLQQNGKTANLVQFSNWMFDIGLSASTINVEPKNFAETSQRKQKNEFMHTHSKTNNKKCQICNGECNNASNCDKFISADRKTRWQFVKQFELCKHCLRKHYGVCYNKNKNCSVEGCQIKHHYLLHGSKGNVSTPSESEYEEELSREIEHVQESTDIRPFNAHNTDKQTILFKIIPVKIYGENNKMISTFAFLDDGSSVSLVEDELLDELNLKGETEQLCLKWTANVDRVERNSQHLNIDVSGSNNKLFSINVRSVKKLMLPKQTLIYENLCQKFKHLKGLPVTSYTAATPRLLIGLNNANLTVSSKVKEGGIKEPIAIKTAIGWTIFGPYESGQSTLYNLHICECSKSDNNIHQIVKHFYEIESLGINCQNLRVNREEEKSMQLLNESTRQREDGHYETCLLWRFEDFTLPNNYEMAKRRLMCLEKKLLKNADLLEVFSKIIEEYSARGYISKVDRSKKADRVWYLPIFPVFNKNKPGKCRIVWDAAAKHNGISLNSMLHKGPDFLASLPAILFKFREKKVAICGDIQQMFHQVFIREEDRHVQRFLWRNCELNKEPEIFIMNVMIFGASCAPCISQYVKNINASKFECQYPQAAIAIKNNHYVDDFLYSTDTIEEAIRISKEVKYIQNCAGFNLRNWCSNEAKVVERLDNYQQENMKPLSVGSDGETEKVLGVFWNSAEDLIVFRISNHILNNDAVGGIKHVTKRQVLKILMSIYDPLGLIGNFLMYLKVILQEIWKSGVGWDEPIKEDQLVKWKKWLQYLPDLENIRIQRCYLESLDNYNNTNTQLHLFVDASENGYAAVAYLRVVRGNSIVCSLVGSKTRVAPLRTTSIPRLELMAALIGTRFANFIIKNHTIRIDSKIFWSDSKTVISWLKHANKKYHQFVALRIGEILESTELEEWHWISGKQNVADEATKWAKKPDISSNSRWFRGPEFLLKPEVDWPKDDIIESTTTEMKEILHVHTTDEIFIDANRFSKWKRLLRATAYVLRFVNILKKDVTSGTEFSTDELIRAEFLLFKLAQEQFYLEEINNLKLNKPLHKSSSLYKVAPKLDENNILRIDSRIDNACLPEEFKYPIILPRASRITYLLIMHFHVTYHHLHHEAVVNELRQRYYIPRLRVAIKSIAKQCQQCRIKKAMVNYPQMAKLPKARVSAFCLPFTYTGLDYFGPIMVAVGRHTEKRYGALFTCLTVRAVHIEVVNTLDTSSCILAIRNFMARRGTPREFFSDNGTNFTSAEREIREAVKDVDRNELVRNFTTTTTKWNFNPPSSPHMGGAWERLVRTIKTVLYNITPTRNPNEELLRGMLAEVENIINSRPLTYVVIDNENAEALTPNHLLVGNSNGIKPLAMYDDSGVALKHNWLRSQQYADRFWHRWVKEYLPTLTLRSKWHEKVEPLKVGDLVVVVDPSSPRNVWPRGKVVEVTNAKDGQVRRAKILTSGGILIRPAAKLAVLNVAPN